MVIEHAFEKDTGEAHTPPADDAPELTIRSYSNYNRPIVGMTGIPMRNLGHYTTALMRRRYDLSRGLLAMVMGYVAFMLGLMVLSTSNSSDPHWFVMLVMILTWLSVFVVLAGFTYISCGILAKKMVRQ